MVHVEKAQVKRVVRGYCTWLARRRRRNLRPEALRFVDPSGDDREFGLVWVYPGEQTCLGCGDTFVGKYCVRCGLPEPGDPDGMTRRKLLPPAVPTESYLRHGEYRIAR